MKSFLLSWAGFTLVVLGTFFLMRWFFPLPALGQEAKFTSPEKIGAGEIATIDYSASVGDRHEINVVPAVAPASLVAGKVPGIVYFATATRGHYLIVVTSYKDDAWTLAYGTITVGSPSTPPPTDDTYGLVAAGSGHPADGAADVQKFFRETAALILAEKLTSTPINVLLKKAAKKWPLEWRADNGWYTKHYFPLIEKAMLVTFEDWGKAYSDIARGIMP